MTPMRRTRVTRAAIFTAGSRPTTGTSTAVRRSSRAAPVAVLQATTISLAPDPARWRPTARARSRTSGVGPVPVRAVGRVGHVEQVLRRQRPPDLARHAEAAHARIEEGEGGTRRS